MKTIVILSTEGWGKMLLSKMHYAIELANHNNRVYFVNPPKDISQKTLVATNNYTPLPNLRILDTKAVQGSLVLRHKLFFLYRFLSAAYIRGIQKNVGGPIDEVWSFDPHLYPNLRKFKAKKTVLFLYDFYKGKHVHHAANSANALVTISKLILDYYQDTVVPKLLLQHGLGQHFADIAQEKLKTRNFNSPPKRNISVGYMGNLLREGMNVQIAKTVIEENAEIEFHFWGPYSIAENNVTNSAFKVSEDCLSFIEFLKMQSNVFLHGMKEQKILAQEINSVDAFLFLYSSAGDMNKASNSHKLLEYLSTGKVVISTHVSNYEKLDLLVMTPVEEDLPALFKTVVQNLEFHNSEEKQQARIEFALENTYQKQINRIQSFLSKQEASL